MELDDKDKDGDLKATCCKATICKNCRAYIRKENMPPYSLTKGVDHGNAHRIGVLPISIVKLHILSLVRTYVQVIKIKGNLNRCWEHTQCTLKGNCIHFPHSHTMTNGSL